jgi:hypothetical protein
MSFCDGQYLFVTVVPDRREAVWGHTAVHPHFPAHHGCAKIGQTAPGQGAAAS